PPITNRTGNLSLNPVILYPSSFLPSLKSSLIIAPMKSDFFLVTYFNVSSNVVYILLANFIDILLAKPGVTSDSSIIVGIFNDLAAMITGTLTKPPLENTRSGFSFFNALRASNTPFNTLNTSFKFSNDKYLRNLPLDIGIYLVVFAESVIISFSIPFFEPI